MAVLAHVGSFAQPGSTGNQAITGVGFRPTVVLFFATHATADGSYAGASQCIGAAVSSSNRCACFVGGADNTSGTLGTQKQSMSLCLTFLSGVTTTVLAQADFVSMDSDGFTVNWTTADSTARIINYLALGGDISAAKIGSFTDKNATGDLAITGVGFRPSSVLFLNASNSNTESTAAAGQMGPLFGVATGASAGWSHKPFFTRSTNSGAKSYQRSDRCESRINATTIRSDSHLKSFDSDGFTLTYDTSDGSSQYCYYVALFGGVVTSGTLSQPTSTGTQAITTTGVAPKALLLASANRTSSASIQAHARQSIGIATSSSARAHVWWGATDNLLTTVVSGDMSRAAVLKAMTEAGASPTTQAVADLSSLDAQGFTLNWTTVDSTAREVLYLVIGDTPVSGYSATASLGITAGLSESALAAHAASAALGLSAGVADAAKGVYARSQTFALLAALNASGLAGRVGSAALGATLALAEDGHAALTGASTLALAATLRGSASAAAHASASFPLAAGLSGAGTMGYLRSVGLAIRAGLTASALAHHLAVLTLGLVADTHASASRARHASASLDLAAGLGLSGHAALVASSTLATAATLTAHGRYEISAKVIEWLAEYLTTAGITEDQVTTAGIPAESITTARVADESLQE